MAHPETAHAVTSARQALLEAAPSRKRRVRAASAAESVAERADGSHRRRCRLCRPEKRSGTKDSAFGAKGGHALAALPVARTASACAADIRSAATATRGLSSDDQSAAESENENFGVDAIADETAASRNAADPQVATSTAEA
jgi:hypothetical protein